MGKYEYSCFNQLDIFGIPPLFTIRGRSTFQTQIGSFITIICVFIILIYLLFFLNEMINHKSPNLQSTIYYDDMPSEINLNNNNFAFVFGLQNKEYINYIDESIYKVNAYQTKLTLNKDGIYHFENEKLKIIKCDEYEFKIIPDKFKKLPLNNLYCLDNNISLKGDYMKEYWNYIKLNFSKCENTTENKCKSEEEINRLLNGGYIGIFIPDNSFDSNKYNNPYKTFIKNIYGAFSIKYFEDIFLYIKLVEITTDSGYFFEDKKSINYSAYDYIQNAIDFRQSEHFLTLTIRISTKREVYKRSYIKLQTIFSTIGGMIKIILLIGEYSVYFIRMTLYKNYILEFFNLDESAIRIDNIRKIYNLSGNNNTKKNNIMSFSKLNKTIDYKLQSKYKINKKIKFKVDDEFENKSNCYNEENSIIINDLSNKENFILSDKLNTFKQNNYITNSKLVYQGNKKKNSLFQKNNIDNTIKKIDLKQSTINRGETVMSSRTVNNIRVKNSNFDDMNRTFTSKFRQTLIIPKTQLRVIKVPGFCSDFVCKKNTLYTIKQVHENYKEIQFLLDIVHYLKSQNELNIIGKYLFTEEQRIALSHTYTFKADFGLERKGYEYMIKHEKNKFDQKNLNNTSQNNLYHPK